eukprot:1101470-Pleurochrysis_carterae.AAC.1
MYKYASWKSASHIDTVCRNNEMLDGQCFHVSMSDPTLMPQAQHSLAAVANNKRAIKVWSEQHRHANHPSIPHINL